MGDFQEALSPWLGPLARAGLLLEGWFPPPWGRLCYTRGRIVPGEVPGRETQVATVCLLSGCGARRWSPLASTAGLGGGSCRPSFAGPQSRFSRWETDVRGHRWPFVLYVTSCLSTPTVSHPRGQPLAFQYPPTPQAALTSDSGESLAIMSPFSYCRIYRNLWQNGQEHGL